LKAPNLTPMKVLVAAAVAVIKKMSGGGHTIPRRKESGRPGENPDFLSSRVLPNESLKLRKHGGGKASQEESTKDDDAEVPVQLWNSWLTILWDGDVLPPPGVANGAEVVTLHYFYVAHDTAVIGRPDCTLYF
jgi:hypothetical protein